jgi:hypothetical protein
MRFSIAHHARRALPTLVACLALASTACVSTDSSVDSNRPTGPWLEPSPGLREQIDEKAKRFPWTHGLERVELIQWFAGIGEPAYSILLDFARDPRPDVSSAALAALGATRDSRLVLHIRAIPAATGPGSVDQNLERARALLRLGDWDAIPELVQGLRDDRVITRVLCSQALFEATRERYDYDPRGEPAAREASIAKWEEWSKARISDPLLQKQSQVIESAKREDD